MTSARRVVWVVVLVAALGATMAIAVAAGAAVPSTLPIADCADVVLPSETEVHTTLDKERGTIELEMYEPGSGRGSALIRFADETCKRDPRMRALIDHVLDVDAGTQAEMCAGMRAILAERPERIRGVPVNLAAGRAYVDRWC